jgi:hypothetical protein
MHKRDQCQKQFAAIDKKYDQPIEQEPEEHDTRPFTLPAFDKYDHGVKARDHRELTRLTDVHDQSSLVGIATFAAYAETHSHVKGDAQQDVIEEAVTQTLNEWVECPHHFVRHTCLTCTPRDASGRKRTAGTKTQIEFTAYRYKKGTPGCGLARLAQRNSSTIRKQRLKYESLGLPDIGDDENTRFSDDGRGARLIEAETFGGSGYDWKTHWEEYHRTSVWKSCLRVGFPPDCEPSRPIPRTPRRMVMRCKHSQVLTPDTCAFCLRLSIERLWETPTFEVIYNVAVAA